MSTRVGYEKFMHACSLVKDRSEKCTFGFLDSNIVDETNSMIATFPDSSLPADNLLSNFIQWNFPNLNFTCNGYIVKWRLRVNASIESNDMLQGPIPHITTWELDSVNRNRYNHKSNTSESQQNMTVINGSVYIEYTPPSPVPIQIGDVIGIMMPAGDGRRQPSVRPLFTIVPENTTTISCARLVGGEHFFLQDRMCLTPPEQQSQYIPLVSAIFSEFQFKFTI